MRLVIIGGVAAGLSAAARARRLDRDLEIVVLEKGGTISYGACGLPFFLEGRVKSASDLVLYTPQRFREERNVDVRTGSKAVAIAHSRREVVLEGSERIRYDRLVIATGARPAKPDISGVDQPHVFTFHTLEEAQRLRDFLRERRPTRAVVIGAGYIGLEIADALRKNGLKVAVLEQSSFVLNRDDAELTEAVKNHLERFQVELRLGCEIRSIEPDQVAGAPCELVVLATGVRPNVDLALDAGIEIGRTGAIRVDENTQTNFMGVFAAGDCAETRHLVTGQPVYLPLGSTANKMGRVAGANAAGKRERFPGIVGTSIVNVFELGIGMTGLSEAEARRQGFQPVRCRIKALSRPSYFQGKPATVELVAERSTRRLLGGSVVGEQDVAGRINVIASALAQRMRVDEFAQLDLAYSPPFAPVWDPLLIAAQQLLKLLD